MTAKTSEPTRLGEFELIARLFAPLSHNFPGAYGLEDDVAYLDPKGGILGADEELVLKTDGIVSGIHFLPDDVGDLVARKLLRVNLSDLAAKGARPLVYTLAVFLPSAITYAWLEQFAHGLKADQDEFGIVLVGGDTDRTPGPLALSLTAIGAIPSGKRLLRSAAKIGDAIFVSGTIGDGTLGLKVVQGKLLDLPQSARAFLADRYRLPQPRLELGRRLRGLVHATMDISDGLIGDLQHICDASHVGACVEAARVPLSEATRTALSSDAGLIENVLSGGDDYELLFTAPVEHQERLAALGHELGVPITRIGRIDDGTGVRIIDAHGRGMTLARAGYQHF